MKTFPGRKPVMRAALMLVAAGICPAQAVQPKGTMPAVGAKPLLLEKNQGELRLRRTTGNALVAPQFLLKVGPQNNGSQHLVLGSEELVPGAVIGMHKHLAQDEIVLVETGSVHANVGDMEGDLHAGGLIFIPADTWITIKNTNDGPTNIVFLFSEPGFDDYMRCTSYAPNEKAALLSREERKDCAHKGHAVFKSLEDPPKN